MSETQYEIISPLGPRDGYGTFDTFWDTGLYETKEEAHQNGEVIIVNFVKDLKGIKYFEYYKSRDPNDKEYLVLQIQNFPFGIDLFDDRAIQRAIAEKWKPVKK